MEAVREYQEGVRLSQNAPAPVGHQNETLIAQFYPESRLLLISGLTNDKPMAVIGKPGNYHHMELKFFYPYIRRNMADRAAAFLAKKKE